MVDVILPQPQRYTHRLHRLLHYFHQPRRQLLVVKCPLQRYLIVFFIFKPPRRALIVTAREMTSAERKRYEREK